MNAVYCLDCDRKLHVNSKYDVGDVIRCPNCHSEFEVVKMHPPAIEWLYDDYDDADDDEDEDDYQDEDEDEVEEDLRHWATIREQKRSNSPRIVFSTYRDG